MQHPRAFPPSNFRRDAFPVLVCGIKLFSPSFTLCNNQCSDLQPAEGVRARGAGGDGLAYQRQNRTDEGREKQLIGFNPTSESITLYHQAGEQPPDGTVWEVLITPSGRRLTTLSIERIILIHKLDLVVLFCPLSKDCGGESAPPLSFMCIKIQGRESSSKDIQ